jgi:hypothetical protein
MRRRSVAWALVSSFALGATLAGADVYVYPAKGQNKEQQERDQFECYKWAKEQTGFDPSRPAQAAGPPPGGAVPGAAKGAAVGAIGGAIGGNAGKGAAIGAGVGGAAGAVRRHRGAAAQQQRYAANRNDYDRAFGACMTGRGYTVK